MYHEILVNFENETEVTFEALEVAYKTLARWIAPQFIESAQYERTFPYKHIRFQIAGVNDVTRDALSKAGEALHIAMVTAPVPGFVSVVWESPYGVEQEWLTHDDPSMHYEPTSEDFAREMGDGDMTDEEFTRESGECPQCGRTLNGNEIEQLLCDLCHWDRVELEEALDAELDDHMKALD